MASWRTRTSILITDSRSRSVPDWWYQRARRLSSIGRHAQWKPGINVPRKTVCQIHEGFRYTSINRARSISPLLPHCFKPFRFGCLAKRAVLTSRACYNFFFSCFYFIFFYFPDNGIPYLSCHKINQSNWKTIRNDHVFSFEFHSEFNDLISILFFSSSSPFSLYSIIGLGILLVRKFRLLMLGTESEA